MLAAAGSHASTMASLRPLAEPRAQSAAPENSPRKIPIGVFDPVFEKLSLDAMIEKISAMGLDAVEIGTGGFPGSPHCPVQELLDDSGKLRAWKKKFTDSNIQVAALSCHGNPLHPDPKRAQTESETFRRTVLLAEKLDVKVIVGFSGCPAGGPNDAMPNWATARWPPEWEQVLNWQWKERVIPYWKQAAQFAREHGIHRLAFEMIPNMVVYNPKTLLRLREAVGPEIGANCDLSHLFWQGCNPVEVIHLLGKQNALFHAHMKDTVMFEDNVAKYGVLNFVTDATPLSQASETFRSVGYGHSATVWKDILKAYMDVGYQGILSIENEDPILPGEVGVERAVYVLKNVRSELLASTV